MGSVGSLHSPIETRIHLILVTIELVRRVGSWKPRDLSRRQKKVGILCFRSVIFVFGCSRRAEMKEDNHIFREKKIWKKNNIFSWRILIFTFSKKYFSRPKNFEKQYL